MRLLYQNPKNKHCTTIHRKNCINMWLDTKVCVGKKNTIYKLMYVYYIVLKFLMIMLVGFVRFKARD